MTTTLTDGRVEPPARDRLRRVLGELWREGAMAPHAPATLARWRRGIGRTHEETPVLAMEISRVFQDSDRDPADEEMEGVFQALALYAVHQQSVHTPMHMLSTRQRSRDFTVGGALRALCIQAAPRHREPWDSEDSRGVVRLMDSLVTSHSVAELVGHLRHTVPLLRKKGIPLDYTRLAEDIRYWATSGRSPRAQTWATHFYRPVAQNTDTSSNEEQ